MWDGLDLDRLPRREYEGEKHVMDVMLKTEKLFDNATSVVKRFQEDFQKILAGDVDGLENRGHIGLLDEEDMKKGGSARLTKGRIKCLVMMVKDCKDELEGLRNRRW